MMLKILFITRKWPPAVGGMETYSTELSNELRKSTLLTILMLSGRKTGQPPTICSLIIFAFRAILHCLKNGNYDVIHIGDMVLWPIALIAKIRKPTAAIVISAHGTDIAYYIKLGIYPKLYKGYLKLGAFFSKEWLHIIANSNATAQHCRNFKFKHVNVIKLGVRARIYDELLIKTETKPYLLFVGRLITDKGAGWFINNVLKKLQPNTILKIAGTKWHESEWEIVKKSSQVEFLGPIYDKELAQIRINSLAVIMPNIDPEGRNFEGFGLTALETPADGGILIASGIHGIIDAVIDGKTGWLVESSNPDDWINKINEISSWSEHKRLKFIKEAKTHILENFSWEKVAKNTLNTYKEILEKMI